MMTVNTTQTQHHPHWKEDPMSENVEGKHYSCLHVIINETFHDCWILYYYYYYNDAFFIVSRWADFCSASPLLTTPYQSILTPKQCVHVLCNSCRVVIMLWLPEISSKNSPPRLLKICINALTGKNMPHKFWDSMSFEMSNQYWKIAYNQMRSFVH